MGMREFGGTGTRASVVGLGCNNFGIYQNAAQAVAVVRKTLDVGINFSDMAGEIDLYQAHVTDPETPREETLRALNDLVRQGKVRAIGEAIGFATANGPTPFATMKTNCSILLRDAEKGTMQ